MDLPTCPGCGQSVLDDDAENCPFCGASMSGKPGKKSSGPAKKTSSPPKAPAPPPASGKPVQKPSRPQAQKPVKKPVSANAAAAQAGQDDLKELGLDSVIPTDAIQASPRQTKSHRFEVTCPMCDTTGYIPMNASNREVKCPNRQCLSPVFKAPEIKRKETVNTTAKKVRKNKSRLIMAGGGVLLFFILIFVAAIFLKRNKTDEPENLPNPENITKTANEETENKNEDPDEVTTPVEEEVVSNEEIIKDITTQLIPSYASVNDRNRSKSYCRRLAAIAFAITGQVDQAKEELANFDKVGSSSPYEKIFPLSEMIWHYLAEGDRENAIKLTEELALLENELPNQGYTAIDSATTIASVYAALDKLDEAKTLVRKYNNPELVGQGLAIVRKSQYLQEFHFDQFLESQRVFDTIAPQWSTVACSLSVNGHDKEALTWCENAPNDLARLECYSEVINALARSIRKGDQSKAFETYKTKITRLPEKFHSTLWARAAINSFASINNETASLMLDEALKVVNKAPDEEAFKIPDRKTLASEELKLDSSPILKALSFYEIARCQHLLAQAENCWSSLVQSHNWLKKSAPQPSEAKTLMDEFKKRRLPEIQKDLKALLDLESEARASLALTQYRNNCRELEEMSSKRYDFTLSLLSTAVLWGLEEEVSKAISDVEDFQSSSLVMLIREKAKLSGQKLEVLPEESNEDVTPSLDQAKMMWQDYYSKGDLRNAMQVIDSRSNSEKPWITIQYLDLTSRIAEDQKHDGMDFLRNLRDPILKEVALRLFAARKSEDGQQVEVWNFMKERRERLNPTERISGLLGTIEGILASEL